MNSKHTTLLVAASLAFSGSLSAQSLIIGYGYDEANSGNVTGAIPYADGAVNDVLGRPFGLTSGSTISYINDTPGGHSNGAIRLTQVGTTSPYLLSTYQTSGAINGLDGALDSLSTFTVAFWIKFDESDAANFALNDRLFAAGARNFGLFVTNPGSGTLSTSNFGLTLDIAGGAATEFRSGGAGLTLSATEWTFIAVTVDLTGATASERFSQLFVGTESEGVELVSTVTGITATSSGNIAQAGLAVGGLASTTNRYVSGSFDDLRIYDAAADLDFIESIRLSNLPASQIPEPASFAALAGLAGLGLAASRRRSRR